MNEREEIENILLTHYFKNKELGQNSPLDQLLLTLPGADKKRFSRVADDLKDKGWIKITMHSYYADVTGSGFLEMQDRGLIPVDKINAIYAVWQEILEYAQEAKDNIDTDGYIDIRDIRIKTTGDHLGKDNNLDFLEDLYLIRILSGKSISITETGTKNLQRWRIAHRFSEEYKRISALQPQQRGFEFENLVTEIFKFNNWNSEQNVSTISEQIDVVVDRDREIYLIECKWQKEPIEAKTVRNLIGILNKRSASGGIIFSVSGFTRGAIEEVKEASDKKILMLFGQADIYAILEHPGNLEELMTTKFRALQSQREVLVD